MDNSNLTSDDYEALLCAKDYLKDYIEAIEKLVAYNDLLNFSIETKTITLNSEIYYAYMEFFQTVKAYKNVIKHYDEILAYFDSEIEIIQECTKLNNKLRLKVKDLLLSVKTLLKQMKKDGLNYPFPDFGTSNPFNMSC